MSFRTRLLAAFDACGLRPVDVRYTNLPGVAAIRAALDRARFPI